MLYQLYSCLFEQHDWRLVCLAAVICSFSVYTALSLAERAADATHKTRTHWLIAAATALGSGVWATHFIAMLGFQPGRDAEYAIGPTLASIAIAILLSGCGLWLLDRGNRTPNTASGRIQGAFGGGVIGAAIGAMHYTGMAAMQLPGTIRYDPHMVALSLGSGILIGMAATLLSTCIHGVRGRLAASALLALGICALHFIGMAALLITFDQHVIVRNDAVPAGLLAVAITSMTVLILALGFAGALLDEHLARHNALEAVRLRASEARFRELANSTFEGIIFHNAGVIRDVNAALCTLLGRDLNELRDSSGLDLVAPQYQPVAISFLQEPPMESVEIGLIHRNGDIIPVEIQARSMGHSDNSMQVVAVRDLRERQRAQEHIHHIAHHDTLTGLANRKLFLERLAQSMQIAQRSNANIAVLCLDLDRFKQVNDLMGHWGGDELLRVAAQRLKDSLRAEDMVARLGGDEFAIIQFAPALPDAPAALAERLVRCMQEPFMLGEQQVLIGTSVGVALYPGDADNGEELLRAADTALYRAKNTGRNGFRFFEAEMDHRLQERAALERDLRVALAQEQLTLHYQPLVDCHTGALSGYEALARWQHPQRGAIPPIDFIPLAEDCGLILPLGNWVLLTACQAATTWPDHLKVAINLSPAQFRHGDLAGDVLNALALTGLAPQRLELEITEGVLITDTETTLGILNRLKAAGVRIALDDFGTGYSSLSYLQRFPFDKIKIDRSFIWEMEHNQESMSIVRAVIALGHSLRITVTAEGVETNRQLALLRHERCDQVQGYLLGRPMSSPQPSDIELIALLSSHG